MTIKTTIRIERVDGPQNSEELYRLQDICLPTDIPADVAAGVWWIAYDADEPVAFGCLCPSYQFSNCAYLARSGVIPAYRGRGLQKRLIRVRLSHAKRLGYEFAITDTTDNPASSNSLIDCGFKLYLPTSPWGLPRACYWRKRLQPAT